MRGCDVVELVEEPRQETSHPSLVCLFARVFYNPGQMSLLVRAAATSKREKDTAAEERREDSSPLRILVTRPDFLVSYFSPVLSRRCFQRFDSAIE